MGRRGSDDKQWQEVKKQIAKRDKNSCRLCRVLTAQEMMVLRRKAGSLLNVLDPAHVFGVGPHPHMVYIEENIYMINRYSHDMLDTFKDPITGNKISREEHHGWWKRIIGEKTYSYLEEVSRNGLPLDQDSD